MHTEENFTMTQFLARYDVLCKRRERWNNLQNDHVRMRRLGGLQTQMERAERKAVRANNEIGALIKKFDLQWQRLKASDEQRKLLINLGPVMTNRKQLKPEDFQRAVNIILDSLEYRQKQKGLGCFTSSHEILGVVTQETSEFEAEVHKKASGAAKVAELTDIAVACLWGIASIESLSVD
jgi:hypothetical protein